MNILFILPSLNIYGGTPKKTLELIKTLNTNTVVYTYDCEYSQFLQHFEQAGAKVFIKPHKRNIFKHYVELRKIIIREKIHLVQTQFTFGEILGFLCKIINFRIKVINTFVGIIKPNIFKKFVLNFIYLFVDQIVYVSNFVKSEKEMQFPILKKKPSKIIYNGTSPRKFSLQNNLPPDRFNLLAIGGLIDVKNFDLLIDMMNILKDDNTFHLTIIGDGPNKNKMISKISGHCLDEHISMLGYIDNVGDYLSSCDIYLHPAYAEGFGISVIEAMFSKKTIIVSNKGSLPEIIINNFSGKILSHDDPLEWANNVKELYMKESIRKELSSNAFNEVSKKFNLKIFSDNYKSMYGEII